MTYEINGINGIYDGYVNNNSTKYGRNAVANHRQLIESTIESGMSTMPPILDFMPVGNSLDKNIEKMEGFVKENDDLLKNLPPVEYQYRYMPKPVNGNIDKNALLGAAREEMGGIDTMSVQEFEHRYLPSKEYTAKPLDINNDGQIDVKEYGLSILAADMLSKKSPAIQNIDGSMNSTGMNAVMEYARISNTAAAEKLYSQIHSTCTFNEVV